MSPLAWLTVSPLMTEAEVLFMILPLVAVWGPLCLLNGIPRGGGCNGIRKCCARCAKAGDARRHDQWTRRTHHAMAYSRALEALRRLLSLAGRGILRIVLVYAAEFHRTGIAAQYIAAD